VFLLTKINSVFDVIIIGGGLAGLTGAIHLSKFNKRVLVIEKNKYPRHKVCGEYVSNEVLPYLEYLGINPFKYGAKRINRFELSTRKNKLISSNLPMGGFGISRFNFDTILAKRAQKNGVTIMQDTVISVNYKASVFIVKTKLNQVLTTAIVIGAFGKRSLLDVKMHRNFIRKKSSYLAVKIHAKGDFPENLVALHNFKGGYCGVSKVEKEFINLCYITDIKIFKKYKNIDTFQKKVLFKNKYLKKIFKNSKPIFDKPLAINQISFSRKKPVENHIIMCGDTAGMIHPLCGNGMSIAIKSAKIASQLILKYFSGEIKSKQELEKNYIKEWNRAFKKRLRVGRIIASAFRNNQISEILLSILKTFSFILPIIIKQTHGKPIVIK